MDSEIIEDGELVSDEEEDNDIETYKPLERPAELLNSHRAQPQENITEDESEVSSDSDSDKGFSNSVKRKKPNKPPKYPVRRKNKYDIWSSRAHEDLLTETIASCEVTKFDRSLGVESYSHRLHQSGRQGIKRRLGEKNVKFRERRENSSERKGESRAILSLCTNIESTDEEVAKDIANKLVEEKDELILRVVTLLGKETAIQLFCDTQKVEAEGGMLIMNGSRRRTPGGVYIYLLKNNDHIPMNKINEIFQPDKEMHKLEKKLKDKEKKKKLKRKIKEQLSNEKLSVLPTRAELIVKDSLNKEFVTNPPPSPASIDLNVQQNPSNIERTLQNYADESFLDIGVENDMDMF